MKKPYMFDSEKFRSELEGRWQYLCLGFLNLKDLKSLSHGLPGGYILRASRRQYKKGMTRNRMELVVTICKPNWYERKALAKWKKNRRTDPFLLARFTKTKKSRAA